MSPKSSRFIFSNYTRDKAQKVNPFDGSFIPSAKPLAYKLNLYRLKENIIFQTFEYCRFKTNPRVIQVDPSSVKAAFQQRAEESGGKLFGCWRSMIGLGIGRDEGIAMTAWPDESSARAAAAPGAPVTDCERQILNATVRPVTDDAPTYEGAYVFRWFDVPVAEWQIFCDLSNTAWPSMESAFDANICGFWRHADTAAPNSKTLLLTRYTDLSVWEASRWWNKPVAVAEADQALSRFRNRNELIDATIAYPALPIFN